jgi:hypothetical protein
MIRPDLNARLSLRRDPTTPGGKAVWTRTIPLRQATTRRTPENPKTNRLTPARLDGARVARALKEDRYVLHCGFNPFFLGAFHQRHKALAQHHARPRACDNCVPCQAKI